MPKCVACLSEVVEIDSTQGQTYCGGCGIVLEENTIVSEVAFGESSSGAAVAMGSYVGAGALRARVNGPHGNRGSHESRELTLQEGQRRIKQVALGLKLSERLCDSAGRWFNLAVSHNFHKGRKSGYVIASCLYITCRMEKTHHMLIDFSDMLQVNVFTLGSTYLKLVKTLNLQLPVMDPSLYISRFAALLEFQDETQKVAHDATRLVQRFSRDWMDTGRRPAGICGACLLLAARMNNFRRSVEEIVQVVKIADTTLKKRLDEFKATASGGLSIAEFRSMWLEETHDPPAYTQSVKKLRKMKRSESELLEDGDEAAETSSQGAERSRSRSTSAAPAGGSSSSSSRKGKGKEVVRAGGLSTLAEEGDGASSFAGSPGPGRGRDDAVFQAAADFDAGDSALLDDDEDGLIDPLLRRGSPAVANARLMLPPPPQRSSSVAGSVRGEGEGAADDDLEKDGVEKADQGEDDVDAEGGAEKPDGAFDAAISGELSSYLATSQAQQLSTELTEVERRREERRLNAGGDLDLDDLDEEELDGLLLTEHEVQIKTRLWMEYNKDYLEKLALKEAKAHGEAANGPKKARKKRSSANPRGTTPAESAKNLVQKKFSRKINYKSIESLFDNSDLPQKMSEHQLRGSEAPSGYGPDDDDEGDGKEKADRNEDDDDDTMAVVEEESDDEPAARASNKRPRHDDGLDDDDRAATRSRKPGAADEPDLAGLYDRGGSDDEGFEEV